MTHQGNAGLLNLLIAIGFIILLLAVINYVNLTIAQQNKRNKDTGLRKTMGASRIEILFHQLSESVLVTTAAAIIAAGLLWLLLPVYRIIFNANVSPAVLFRFPTVLILLVSVFLTGVISGTGPAVILSAVNPVKILSSSKVVQGKKKLFYNSLTVFQFTISITLIFCVLIVMKQIAFVKHRDPGFKKEQLVRLDLPDWQESTLKNAASLVEEYRRSPFIKAVSATSGVPGDVRMFLGTNMGDTRKYISIPSLMVDTAFLRTFGLKVVKGRDLQPGDFGKVCMFNESAYKHFEFDDLNGKRFDNFGGLDLVGVVNDFQFASLHEAIGPMCILFTPKATLSNIIIRFREDGAVRGLEIMKSLWNKFLPGQPLKFRFYDEWYESMYQSEERFASTIGLFAILAIIISCIGILGLATFSAERRTKEIGIRKTNGAMVSEVLIMLNSEYVRWIVAGLIVSAPVSFYSMNIWLSGFAYRTPLRWWYFLISGGLALAIAMLTVSWQSWRAATVNPSEALKYE
jgi:putative ABC transport system permease protein